MEIISWVSFILCIIGIFVSGAGWQDNRNWMHVLIAVLFATFIVTIII